MLKPKRLLFLLVMALLFTSVFLPTLSFASTTMYVVKKGDYLFLISQRYKTSVTALKQLNHLKSDKILIGEKLIVPSLPTTVGKPAKPVTTAKSTTKTVSIPTSTSNPIKPTAQPSSTVNTKPISQPTAPIMTPVSTKNVGKEVLGFTVKYSSTDNSSYNSILSYKDSITSIATATKVVDGLGNLTGITPSEQLNLANSNHIKPILMIGNEFSRNVAISLLDSSNHRQNLINNTIQTLQTYGYKGVNIDLEDVPSTERANYTAFIKQMSSVLKPLGYELSVAVPAKTIDSSSYSWTYAYDYKALSSYVDYLMIMSYDEHYTSGLPGSVASIGWVTNVINYSLTVVPKEKIMLGLASYGYDWASGVSTRAYGINDVLRLATDHHASILFDSISKESHFTYTDARGLYHNVWFEDAKSISYKLDLVNSKGLRGVGIWRLGLENQDYWNMIAGKL